MTRLKQWGVMAGVALAVLAAGYVWGAWGRRAAERELARSNALVALGEARRHALSGSLDLYKLNFGAAATHFETARATTDRVRGLLTDAGSTADPADLAAAVTALDEARALAAKLDQAAGQKAAAAITLLDKAASAP
jgi:hypothetical protein